jgi:CheY-like chemotaxis protein
VRNASVMLIEDEALIRMMTSAMLEELGHNVVAEAATLEDAERLAETAYIDLALLDVNLGGRSAAPVADILLKRGLPFVFVTGYASDNLPDNLGKGLVLEKPFLISKLKDAIETILAG